MRENARLSAGLSEKGDFGAVDEETLAGKPSEEGVVVNWCCDCGLRVVREQFPGDDPRDAHTHRG